MHLRPFLVMGTQRSGSTILARILRQHTQLFVTIDAKLLYYLIVWLVQDPAARLLMHPRLDEISFALNRKSVRGNPTRPVVHMSEQLSRMRVPKIRSETEFLDFVGQIWKNCYQSLAGHRCICGDKYNEYVLYIDQILSIIPEMRFIVIERNERECAASALQRFSQRSWQPNSLDDALEKVRRWKLCLDKANLSDHQLLRIHFEELRCERASTLRLVCDFLELSVCADMMESAWTLFKEEKVQCWNYPNGVGQ